MPKVPANVLPKMLSREPSRAVSRLRFRGCGRDRAPSLSWEMSDRGVVTSGDLRAFPVEEDELWRPNSPRPLVATFLVSLSLSTPRSSSSKSRCCCPTGASLAFAASAESLGESESCGGLPFNAFPWPFPGMREAGTPSPNPIVTLLSIGCGRTPGSESRCAGAGSTFCPVGSPKLGGLSGVARVPNLGEGSVAGLLTVDSC